MDISLLLASYAISLPIQVLLLIYVWAAKIRTGFLGTLIALFIFINTIFPIGIFIGEKSAFTVEFLLRLYYTAYPLLAACTLSYAIQVRSIVVSESIKQFEKLMWLLAFCIGILSLVTDEILAGYRPLSFTYTAIEGDSYWLCLVHVILATFAAIAILVQELANLRYENQKRRCLLILGGYLSFVLSTSVVIVLLRYGYEINMSTIFPFTSLPFLCVIVYGEAKYRKRTTVNTAPEQNESAGYDELFSIFTKFREHTYSFNEASEKIDYLLLTYAYDKYNGNIMKTSEAVGLGRSTLYRKMQKHDLK